MSSTRNVYIKTWCKEWLLFFFLYYETNSYHVLSIKHIIVAKEELKSFNHFFEVIQDKSEWKYLYIVLSKIAAMGFFFFLMHKNNIWARLLNAKLKLYITRS